MAKTHTGRLKILSVFFALSAAGVAYVLLPADCPDPARRMAFIFVIAALFWALEIIPLYATSLAVVILEAFLLAKPGGIFGISRNDYTVFLVPFSNPVIMLFLGGFVLARAFQKYKIDRWIASRLISLFGTKRFLIGLPIFAYPGFWLIIVLCLITVVLSTFMSNTATANLMIPIALSIPGQNPIAVAVIITLASSFDLALPIATPSMAIAYGTGEIRVRDMLRAGVFFTVIANVLLLAGFQFFIGSVLVAK